MQPRLVLVEVMVVLAIGACGNDKMHLHPDGVFVDARPDAPPDPYWMPSPGEAKNWDIQINAPFDFDTPRAMMVIDLWDSVPTATTIPYADGDVAVPQGTRADTISKLQANDTIVICRVGLGGVHTGDPDYSKFPAAAIGPSGTPFDANDRYLDLSVRDTWKEMAFKRLDLASAIGCDGIEPYLADHDTNTTGFATSAADLIAWQQSIATEVHEREMSAGMRNGAGVNGLIDTLVPDFDWILVERCGELGDCNAARSFLNVRKPIFGIDYTTELVTGDAQDPMAMCALQKTAMVQDGIVKDVALTSVRTPCN